MDKNKQIQPLDGICGLIEELSREKPDAKVLKRLCGDVGIAFDSDLVQLMSKVLIHASGVSPTSMKAKKTTKIMIGEA